jgi:chromosome segregation ATPase
MSSSPSQNPVDPDVAMAAFRLWLTNFPTDFGDTLMKRLRTTFVDSGEMVLYDTYVQKAQSEADKSVEILELRGQLKRAEALAKAEQDSRSNSQVEHEKAIQNINIRQTQEMKEARTESSQANEELKSLKLVIQENSTRIVELENKNRQLVDDIGRERSAKLQAEDGLETQKTDMEGRITRLLKDMEEARKHKQDGLAGRSLCVLYHSHFNACNRYSAVLG